MKKLFILSTLAAFVFVPSSAIAQNSGIWIRKKRIKTEAVAPQKKT
jgi:uncharacterized protein YggU (UPF0235/DUF167 family)